MVDATGAVTQRMSYDEYGNLSSGSTQTGQPFRYTGRRFDIETGLYYYRARYYSPTLGRFLQTDPIGYRDDVNLYTYVYNDPLNKSDPSGACEVPSTGCNPTSGNEGGRAEQVAHGADQVAKGATAGSLAAAGISS